MIWTIIIVNEIFNVA